MCGFFGYADWAGIAAHSKMSSLFKAISHRGPDDRGLVSETWFEVAHTRLSIQDLSWRGHQPFYDRTRRFVATYNGEIYNFKEINHSLEKMGVDLLTGSDTETLVENFSLKGNKAFPDFHGMFAGAIFDRKEKSLFLFRDRLGVKPLYYSIRNNRIAFGSTPILVSKLMGGLPIDELQRRNYLAFRVPAVDRSMFADVFALRPGVVLKCTQQGVEEIKFWDIRDYIGCQDYSLKEEDVMHTVRDLLSQAVQKRLVGDVPVGAFLSGGLDSTVVVHHMAKLCVNPVYAHTFSSLLDSDDEAHRAKKTADYYGARCDVMRISYDNYLDDISLLTHMKGAPLCVPNEYAIYKMAQKMKPINTIVLSGEGSDELFWGYSRIFTAAAEAKYVVHLDEMAQWIFEKYCYVSPGTLRRVGYDDKFLGSYIEDGVAYIRDILNDLGGGSLSDNVQYFFMRHHLPALLMRLDNATMGASIEGRAPFTDHHLVEFALKIPPAMKLGNGEGGTSGKRILYRAYDDLPEWVIKTPKIGFKLGDTLEGRHEFIPYLQNVYPGGIDWFSDGSIPPVQKWHLTMLALFSVDYGA